MKIATFKKRIEKLISNGWKFSKDNPTTIRLIPPKSILKSKVSVMDINDGSFTVQSIYPAGKVCCPITAVCLDKTNIYYDWDGYTEDASEKLGLSFEDMEIITYAADFRIASWTFDGKSKNLRKWFFKVLNLNEENL